MIGHGLLAPYPASGLIDSPSIDEVRVDDLTKSFGGVRALDGMDLAVKPGQIHAVVGENGAGKSTLMKILAGAIGPDSGTIRFRGQPIAFESPAAARARGVGIVYQELSLFPQRSVLANLLVNTEPTRYGLISRREMIRLARPILERVGLRIDLDRSVGAYGIAEQQLIEIARVLLQRPRLLILDEPNSALNERETKRLFSVLRELSAGGVTMLYVSHRLQEVFLVSDHITVMRNGRQTLTQARKDVTLQQVVQAMIGGTQQTLYPARNTPPASWSEVDAGLAVENLSVTGELEGISLEAHRGEIVGLAGLEGSGVETLLGVLFGLRPATASSVRYPDGKGLPASPTAAARRKVSLVPADRRRHGLMLQQSLAWNVVQVRVGTLPARSPFLRRRELLAATRRQIANIRIQAGSVDTPVNQLSGGNQQKTVLAKWLEVQPDVVLLDDPTRGVDIGAKREIYQLIRRLADEGHIVIFRSTELPELIGLADRIVVLYRHRVVGEVRGTDTNDHDLLHIINTGELPVNEKGVLHD